MDTHILTPTDDLARSLDMESPLMLIDGEWVAAASGEQIEVLNPARRGQVLTHVPRAGAPDVDRAVAAAKRAFPDWSRKPPQERARALLEIASAIEANREQLARVIAASGIAIRTQARPEATTAAGVFRYFAGLAHELKGETVPIHEGVLSYTRREALGVVGAIIPWNAPVLTGVLKLAPALCAGNTVVLKAAEDAPLGALALARICAEHLPPGVLNVLTGTGPEAGAALTSHPDVAKLSFTGSTAVGKTILRASVDRLAHVTLELGGKSPQIVYPDVGDDDRVVEGVLNGMRFTRQTQSCSAGTRLFLHADVLDAFMAKLIPRIDALRPGDPYDEAADMGTLINKRQFDRVCGYISDGLSSGGGKLVSGGLPPTDGALAQGYYVPPTVFLNQDNHWRLAQEEIFGPVLVVIPWSDESEALRMANDSHYGLAGYIWTHDVARGIRAAHALESGWIQINQSGGQMVGQSYGGYKQSGIGKEFSLEGMLEDYTQRKSVTVNIAF